MTEIVPRWVVAICVIALGWVPAAMADEKPAKEEVGLDPWPEQIANMNDEQAQKVDAVRAIVEKEAAAKRLSEATAQSLRWSLRTSRSSVNVDVRGILATARVPEDNAVLTQAFRELETYNLTLQSRRAVVAKGAVTDLKRRLSDTMRHAQKTEPVDALLSSIDAVNDVMTQHPEGADFSELRGIVLEARRAMHALKRLLET